VATPQSPRNYSVTLVQSEVPLTDYRRLELLFVSRLQVVASSASNVRRMRCPAEGVTEGLSNSLDPLSMRVLSFLNCKDAKTITAL
jgi:hypothetical protein